MSEANQTRRASKVYRVSMKEFGAERKNRFVAGIALTMAVHGLVFAVAYLARAQAAAKPLLVTNTFVDAQLVKFGKPRDLTFLPHKQGEVKPPPQPNEIKVARDLHDLPHIDEKTEKPVEVDPLKKTHAELFKQQTEQEGAAPSEEGSLTGSRAGNATEAKGDPYILLLVDRIGSAWNVPTTIKDSELRNLSADTCLTINSDGKLTRFEIERASGNSQFDSSLEAALATIHDLPPPPARFASAAARGKLCPTFSKQN